MAFKDSAKVDKFLLKSFNQTRGDSVCQETCNSNLDVRGYIYKSNDQFRLGDCSSNEDPPTKLTFNGISCPFELRIPDV